MIDIVDKSKCSGCAACAAVCPANCIGIHTDEEGFYYPVVDKDSCINCGLCERICPIQNPVPETEFEQEGYVVQSKDPQILRESTAGGTYTALASHIIGEHGAVFGAAFDEDLSVKHICVENAEELWRFRNSKYVQSYMDPAIFRKAKKYLQEGRPVLFSGTPCQIEGLLSYLGKEYPNLYTLDVVCRAVPSPLILKKYIEYQTGYQNGKVESIRFRDKHYGYKFSTLHVVTEENKGNYHRGIESDPWLRAFFSDAINRPSCYACHFKKRFRRSDFTVWDCFQTDRFTKELDNDKGATRMLIHTKKGKELFGKVEDQYNYVKIDADKLVTGGTLQMTQSVPKNEKLRKKIFSEVNELDGFEFMNKNFPIDLKHRFKHVFRLLMIRMGIYKMVKKCYQIMKKV